MEKRRSIKHHYLPRHYLKGFTNPDGSFFVYDKKADNIFTSSPGSFFFEKDLNTINLKGGASDFLEDMYTSVEGKFWNSLDTIRDSSHLDSITILDKMNLFFFLSIQHWRLPRNSSHVESLSKEFFMGKKFNYFKLNSKSGNSIPEEEIQKLTGSDSFKKSARLMIPFAPFYTKEWADSINNWNFSYSGDNGNWHMVGDSPIITDGEHDHDPEKCLNKFIFPVSGKILLINNGKKLETRDLPADFILQYNVALLHRAERFIACPNKDFLKAVVFLYKDYENNEMTHLIQKELFWHLK